MKRWTIGVLTAGCAGLGLYLATAKQHPAEAPPEVTPAAVAVMPPAPPAPVVLAEVVEVADLDPLLDPQVKPAGGAAFDPEPVVVPAFNFAPARIPPAVD